MTPCPRTAAVLADLDAPTDPDPDLADHAANCPACRAAVAAAGRDLPAPSSRPDPPPASFLDRLSAAVLGKPLDDASARPPDVPGFDVFEEVGRGGSAVVYRARQKPFGRTVALKVLRADHADRPEDLIRAGRGVAALAAVRHPNVIQIFEAGRRAGWFFAAQEFAPGGSLAARLTGTPWPPADAARFVRGVALGVAALHAAGYVHRDLKPANVLLGEDGEPKVADLGLARRIDDPDDQSAGAVLGTPAAMAPEQAAGEPAGPAADVYALGRILFHLLTGRPPPRPAPGVPTPRPAAVTPGVPAALDRLCVSCLAADPAARCPSAATLAAELGRFLTPPPSRTVPARVALAMLALGAAAGWAFSEALRPPPAVDQTAAVRLLAADLCVRSADREAARKHLDAVPPEHRTAVWADLHAKSAP